LRRRSSSAFRSSSDMAFSILHGD